MASDTTSHEFDLHSEVCGRCGCPRYATLEFPELDRACSDPRVNSSIDPDGTDDEGPEWDCDRGFPDDAEEEDDGDE